MSAERFAVDLGNGVVRLPLRNARNLHRILGAWLRDQDEAPSEWLLAEDLERFDRTRARLATTTDPDELAHIAEFDGDLDRAAEAYSGSSIIDGLTDAYRAKLETNLAAEAASRNIR